MPSNVKIDFYTVDMPGGGGPFEQVVLNDGGTANDESRNLTVGSCPVRLQSAHASRDCIDGDMLRIQMDDLPPKAQLSGRIGNLGLASDEGIGGETAFLYQPHTRVLVIQRNRGGVSAKAFASYFSVKSGVEIVLTPVFQQDAMRRLMSMRETRKLKVRFAGITNPQFFKDSNKSLNEMIDVIEAFKAPSATFELSMGHQPGTLAVQKVVDFVKKCVNLHSDADGGLSTLEVSGVLDDDSRDVFDVLAYRMVEVVAIKETRYRRSNYTNRRPEIRQAWERRRAELEAMYGGQHGRSR